MYYYYTTCGVDCKAIKIKIFAEKIFSIIVRLIKKKHPGFRSETLVYSFALKL